MFKQSYCTIWFPTGFDMQVLQRLLIILSHYDHTNASAEISTGYEELFSDSSHLPHRDMLRLERLLLQVAISFTVLERPTYLGTDIAGPLFRRISLLYSALWGDEERTKKEGRMIFVLDPVWIQRLNAEFNIRSKEDLLSFITEQYEHHCKYNEAFPSGTNKV